MISIDDAIDTFVDSYAHTRSITHPVEVVAAGRGRVVQDLPGRKDGPRNSEFVARPATPIEETLAALASYPFAGGYLASLFQHTDADPGAITRPMKYAGYRLARSEPLMAIETASAHAPGYAVKRVQSDAEAAALRSLTGRCLHPGEAADPNARCRVYYVEQDGKPIAWGRTIQPAGGASYIGALNTRPEYRRRGLATAVLAAMLIDDRERGAESTVLLATKAGEQVYLRFGFTTLARLLIFNPPRK